MRKTLAILTATGTLALAGCTGEGPLAPPSYECFRVADPYAVPGVWQVGNLGDAPAHSLDEIVARRIPADRSLLLHLVKRLQPQLQFLAGTDQHQLAPSCFGCRGAAGDSAPAGSRALT